MKTSSTVIGYAEVQEAARRVTSIIEARNVLRRRHFEACTGLSAIGEQLSDKEFAWMTAALKGIASQVGNDEYTLMARMAEGIVGVNEYHEHEAITSDLETVEIVLKKLERHGFRYERFMAGNFGS